MSTIHQRKREVVQIIEPTNGYFFADWKEIFAYRDLLGFLIWREIKVRYAQSAIGIGWSVIQPLFSMIVFTVVFGRLAKVESDGVPYALFSFAALIPWIYFSNAVSDGVSSLVNEAHLIRKIYFPRILVPLAAVGSKLLDFAIALIVLFGLMLAYQHLPDRNLILLPIPFALLVVSALAVSSWLAALAVQYRDVKHAMTFALQLAMYASPVVYPVSIVPSRYHSLYALNPMVGVIEGFRSGLLATQPMPWNLLAISSAVSFVALFTGLAFFSRKERIFADVA